MGETSGQTPTCELLAGMMSFFGTYKKFHLVVSESKRSPQPSFRVRTLTRPSLAVVGVSYERGDARNSRDSRPNLGCWRLFLRRMWQPGRGRNPKSRNSSSCVLRTMGFACFPCEIPPWCRFPSEWAGGRCPEHSLYCWVPSTMAISRACSPF